MRTILCLVLLVAICADSLAATSLYTSPTGSGTTCSESSPCSINTAKTTARLYTSTGDVTVHLRGGTYDIATPLIFSSADSGVGANKVFWRNYPGETPVLSGGVRVTGWTQVGTTGIWQTSVPSGVNARQLWVNGNRATRSRRTVQMSSFSTSNGSQYVSTDGTLPTFSRPSDIEFVFNGPSGFLWVQNRLGVSAHSRVGNTSTFTMDSGGATAWRTVGLTWPNNPTWIENAYEFLSASTPGQWYLNPATSTVYYVPTASDIASGGMSVADVRFPIVDEIVTSAQSDPPSNIEFNGLTLAYTGWTRPSDQDSFVQMQTNRYLDAANGYAWSGGTGALSPKSAVKLSGATNVNFIKCTFTHLGGEGVLIRNGSKNCSVTNSILTDISSNAIELGDVVNNSPIVADRTSNITVSNNIISYVGVEYWGGAGVMAGYVDHMVLTHNEISQVPYSGVTFGWGWAAVGYSNSNEVGWNKIHDVLTQLHDGAGIYSLGLQGDSGNRSRVHDNYLYNVGNGTNQLSDSGLYADQGTNYVDYTNNIIVRAGANPNVWWFSNGSDSGNNTAAGNYATSNLGIATNNGASSSGISAATVITGTDPTGWPAGAQAIATASGPTDVVTVSTAVSTATMRASFR